MTNQQLDDAYGQAREWYEKWLDECEAGKGKYRIEPVILFGIYHELVHARHRQEAADEIVRSLAEEDRQAAWTTREDTA